MDVFLESALPVEELGGSVNGMLVGSPVELKMISSRGTRIFPPTGAMTDTVDLCTCRIVLRDKNGDLNDAEIADLLGRLGAKHRWMHVEKLNEFDGVAGYTRAQGED